MTDREHTVKWLMGYCKHFNGIHHDQCNAGVIYRDHFGDAAGWARNIHCLVKNVGKGTFVACPKFEATTLEEANRITDEFEEAERKLDEELRLRLKPEDLLP